MKSKEGLFTDLSLIGFLYRDFVEGSSESEDTSYSLTSSTSSSESSGAENTRQKSRAPIRKSPVIVQTKSFSVTRVPIRRKITKKDRFYDKSRDIPNDVYFGDVKGLLSLISLFSFGK